MPKKLVSFDWAIKRILRSKANFAVLEGFLSELLFEEIHILEVLESESNQEQDRDKFNRLDIKVKNSHQEIILIEIQYSSELDYLQRILYATSRAVTEHLNKGDAYSKINKVISVNILYFDFGDGDDYLYKGSTQFVGMNNQIPLRLNAKQTELYQSDQVAALYPEYYLIKINNFDDQAKNSLDEWIYFLKNEEIKDHFNARGLKQAKETLDYLKMPKAERLRYQRHEDNAHHRASLHESTFIIAKMEGIEEGIEQEKQQSEQKLAVEKQKLAAEKQKRQQQQIVLIQRLAQQGFDPAAMVKMLDLSLQTVNAALKRLT